MTHHKDQALPLSALTNCPFYWTQTVVCEVRNECLRVIQMNIILQKLKAEDCNVCEPKWMCEGIINNFFGDS